MKTSMKTILVMFDQRVEEAVIYWRCGKQNFMAVIDTPVPYNKAGVSIMADEGPQYKRIDTVINNVHRH